MNDFIFFFSAVMIFYIYLGYPIAAFLISLIKNQKVNKGNIEPNVTILIAAFNEADNIAATIENKFELDYPTDKLEIIVISDESSDGTDDIVKQYKTDGVKLLRQQPRAGKTSALNLAVPVAKGEILVFSDANSIYDRDAIKKLIANFQDPSVGYVTGKMVYTKPDGSLIGDGCSSYMKYENALRYLESRCGSIVGVDGGIDAVRKSLYQPMKAEQLPDFVLPLKVATQEYRIVYEPGAVLKEPSLASSKDEYRMRVRVALRAMWALFDMRHLLSFKRYGLFAFQLWSHKVLRYLCFVFLVSVLISNFLIWSNGTLYKLFFVIQLIAIAGALMSPHLEKRGKNLMPLRFLNYFYLLNIACAHAFIKFIAGKKQVLWTPRKG